MNLGFKAPQTHTFHAHQHTNKLTKNLNSLTMTPKSNITYIAHTHNLTDRHMCTLLYEDKVESLRNIVKPECEVYFSKCKYC